MTAYFRFVLKHRVIVLIACGLITVLAVAMASRATMATSLVGLVLGEHPAYHRYAERARHFGSGEEVIVAFSADLADPGERARLRRITERVAAIDEVTRVISPLSLAGRAGERDVEALRRHPLARGLLVSDDGGHAAVVAELTADAERALKRTPGIVADIAAVFADEGYARRGLHLGGIPVVLAQVHQQTVRNIVVLTPLVAVVLLATTWVLFRRLWPVLVTLAIVALIAIGIAVDDTIHFLSRYRLERRRGLPSADAIAATYRSAGRGIVMTSLIFAAGFAPFALSDYLSIRMIGILLPWVMIMALLADLLLLPALVAIGALDPGARSGK